MLPCRVHNSGAGPVGLLVVERDSGGPHRLRVVDGPRPLAVLHRFGRWKGLLLDGDVGPGGSIVLETEGPIRAALLPRSRTCTPERPPWRRLGRPAEASEGPESRSPESPAARDDVPADPMPARRHLLDLRQAEIDSIRRSSPHGDGASLAWMWWHLDVNTHTLLLEDRHQEILWPERIADPAARAERVRSVHRVLVWLCERASARWTAARGAPSGPTAAPLGRRGVPTGFGAIAALVRRIMAAWHPGLERDPITSGFAESCIAFASGELALLVEPAEGIDARRRSTVEALRELCARAQPESLTIVCFAELALAAIDEEMDPQWWTAALRCFVAMLEPFQLAYGTPDGRAASPESYRERARRPPSPGAMRRARQVDAILRCEDAEALAREYAARLLALSDRPLVAQGVR